MDPAVIPARILQLDGMVVEVGRMMPLVRRVFELR